MARRRSIALDEEHARLLEELARRYGVPMSSYLRGLLEAAWEAEERGLNAASLLRRAAALEAMIRLGAVPAPARLLSYAPLEEVEGEAQRLGASLRGVAGVETVYELLAALAERSGAGVAEYTGILILDPSRPEARLILGLARGAGLRVEEAEPGLPRIARPR